MSPGLIKMWFSLSAIGLMFIAVISILISRTKLKGIWKFSLSTFAYICMVVSGIIMFFVVFSGPVQE
jgi:glucan phosphoethanolaminetransferase (alkaline phosphatase superfamily)